MSQNDIENCSCSCHTNNSMMHCFPCCCKCPNCGSNIKVIYYDNHIKNCNLKVNIDLLKLISEAKNV